jgi:hypothetical protein
MLRTDFGESWAKFGSEPGKKQAKKECGKEKILKLNLCLSWTKLLVAGAFWCWKWRLCRGV